jgi:hypothetical protein
MHKGQRVSEMALEVLRRQATTFSKRTGEPLEKALEEVQRTEAGKRLRRLSEGPHRNQSAHQWQQDLPRKRAEERRQDRLEERRQAQQQERSQARRVAWEEFIQAERRALELRKNGQLATMLGEPLPWESPAELVRLACEDRRQAEEEEEEEELVALTHDGEVFYKHLDELSEEDMTARIAASRLRAARPAM